MTLRFSTTPTGDGAAVREYAFGDVHGPVQTGSGQQYTAGRDQYVAGRDLYHDNSVRVENDYDPWDELFRGRGIGRVLMLVGGLIALTGFGIVGYFIFVFAFGSDIDDFGGPGELSNPFQKELLPGVPMVAAGFGLFLAGGILAGIGGGMSKAARKREALAGLRLTEAERSSAERDLQGLEEAVAGPEPDTKAASQHLQSFTANLKEAGALATAGVALVEGIAKIAQWLGPLGAGVLALL